MVSAPNSTWFSPVSGWPLVVGGSTTWPCGTIPMTGNSVEPRLTCAKPSSDQPRTPGWSLTNGTSGSLAPMGQLPQPPDDSMNKFQFQPYRAGCVVRPVRLAPNTSAATRAATATTEPVSVTSTGALSRPVPRSSAWRIPVTTVTGSAARLAAATRADALRSEEHTSE